MSGSNTRNLVPLTLSLLIIQWAVLGFSGVSQVHTQRGYLKVTKLEPSTSSLHEAFWVNDNMYPHKRRPKIIMTLRVTPSSLTWTPAANQTERLFRLRIEISSETDIIATKNCSDVIPATPAAGTRGAGFWLPCTNFNVPCSEAWCISAFFNMRDY